VTVSADGARGGEAASTAVLALEAPVPTSETAASTRVYEVSRALGLSGTETGDVRIGERKKDPVLLARVSWNELMAQAEVDEEASNERVAEYWVLATTTGALGAVGRAQQRVYSVDEGEETPRAFRAVTEMAR
jgi:hypothetical protein